MNTIGSLPPPTFQTVPAHSPLGKPAVGLEAADAPLPPVEESTPSEELRHRDVIAKQRKEDGRRESGHHPQQHDSEPEQNAQQALEAQLALAAQTAPIASQPAIYQARHLSEFERHTLPPGLLLDQQV